MPTRLTHIVIDANDPNRLSEFWAETLGWQITLQSVHEVEISPGDDAGLPLIFVPVPEPKSQKNRLHIDLASGSAEHQAETVDRLIACGAREIDIGQPTDAQHVVLADPEGNEFCVTAPGELFTNTGPIEAIAYDAADIVLGRFWSEATGWPISYERGPYIGLRSADGHGPFITFGPPVASKRAKNRCHLDVAPPPGGSVQMEVKRLVGLGASPIDVGQGDVPWVVLSDPEGNEFCVLTPR